MAESVAIINMYQSSNDSLEALLESLRTHLSKFAQSHESSLSKSVVEKKIDERVPVKKLNGISRLWTGLSQQH